MNLISAILIAPLAMGLSPAPTIDSTPVPTPTVTSAPSPTPEPSPEPYTPPVLDCGPGTVPGWLNEHGDPTSCINNTPVDLGDCWDGLPRGAEGFCNPFIPPALPSYELIACPTEGEDLSYNCYWDAELQGNGLGKSFIQLNGKVYYLP